MAKVDPTLWRDIMEYLRRRHAPICRQWFEDLQPVELHSGLLKVHTSTSVQRNYLQKKCLDQFTEAAQATTGALVAVRFVNEDEVPIYDDAITPEIHIPRPGGFTPPAPGTSGTPGTPGINNNGGSSRHGGGFGITGVVGTAGLHHSGTESRDYPRRPEFAPTETAAPRSDLRNQTSASSLRARASESGAVGAKTDVLPSALPPRPVNRPQYLGGNDGDTPYDQIVISPDYTFENFVTGPGNHLAYAASVAVANQPGTSYNPLFIHGGVGLGKTHLLQAICQGIMQKRPELRLCYLSCDSFTNHFHSCVQSGKMSEFRTRYRHVDVLVIDDIHFLANLERTQEEFFHTFNALYQSNRQIILSSDSPPGEIPQLEERLISRFQWGLVAHVSKPCYETRVAIIRAKAKVRGLTIPDDVVSYIATRFDSNARELEGAINTIQGHSVLQNRAIDLALAHAAMGDSELQNIGSQVTLHNIIDAVTAYYSVKLSDLQSKRRHKSITGPRQVCMWLARKRTRFSLEEIGAYFGGRDHTTVMHSIKTVDEHMGKDPSFASQVEALTQQVSKGQGSPATAAAVPVGQA